MWFSEEIINKSYFKLLSDAIMSDIKERRANIRKIGTGGMFPTGPLSAYEYLNEGSIEYLYKNKLLEYHDAKFIPNLYGELPEITYQTIGELAVLAIYNNDIKFLTEELLQAPIEDFVKAELIDILLECSIDNQRPEITAILLEYKDKNNLFTKPKLEL